jgi:1-acyl-sn-glycerol-3-phosphate acyltransferase
MRVLKLAVVVFLFGVFIIGALILRFYAVTDVNKRRISIWFTTKMCRIGLKVFGIKASSSGTENIAPSGRLIISNHMSYLDIIIYASIAPTVFISSVEVRHTPFLGFVAALGGTFFVERRNPKLIRLEINGISELIESGFNVMLFPEGTSTDGSEILPFRSSLLAAAGDSVLIVPACLRYDSIDGEFFSAKNCDYVCWYGDMSFAPHLWNFLSTKQTLARAVFFEPISSASANRKYISSHARQLIVSEYFGEPAISYNKTL